MKNKYGKEKCIGTRTGSSDREVLEKKVEPNLQIPVDQIDSNPFQPRTLFDDESLGELAASIRQLGIVQPLTVRETGIGRYQLIAGERRLRAARLAGLTHIPAFVRTADDQAMLEIALVENIQREDLDAIDVAISFSRLVEECRLTQEELSERVGKQRSTVANYLRLLKLPPEIQLGIKNKQITMGHARALISIEDPEMQMKIFNKIISSDLSVRATEKIVKALQGANNKNPDKSKRKKKLNDDFLQLSSHLEKIFSSKVILRINEKGKGKIVIHFSSPEEMERIMSVFDRLS